MVRDQKSFIEAFASTKLGRNARLERLAEKVRWYRFEKLLRKLEPESAGRPPYDPLMMFKALLLQQWYALSDAQLEEMLNDRVSFRRFLGLALDADAPDYTTLCRFRNRLARAGLIERLFAEFDRQMEQDGLVLKRGTMVDATLIEAACSRPPPGGEGVAGDPDARFAKKEGRPGSTHGYKAHIGVDQGTRLIRSAMLTPANVNETEVADALLRNDEQAVYGDKAYDTHERRARLRKRGTKDRIMHRANKHHPELPPRLALRNRLIAPIRASVETVFAVIKRRMGLVRARYVGLAKNSAHLILLALAYNMRRSAALLG
jgi:transposase, IS5 family